jgi:hypothetical protein
MRFVLLIILRLLAFGALPTWLYSAEPLPRYRPGSGRSLGLGPCWAAYSVSAQRARFTEGRSIPFPKLPEAPIYFAVGRCLL